MCSFGLCLPPSSWCPCSITSLVPEHFTFLLYTCPPWMRICYSTDSETSPDAAFTPRTRDQSNNKAPAAQPSQGSWLGQCLPAGLVLTPGSTLSAGMGISVYLLNLVCKSKGAFYLIDQRCRCPIWLFCCYELTNEIAPSVFLWEDAEPLHLVDSNAYFVGSIGKPQAKPAPYQPRPPTAALLLWAEVSGCRPSLL